VGPRSSFLRTGTIGIAGTAVIVLRSSHTRESTSAD